MTWRQSGGSDKDEDEDEKKEEEEEAVSEELEMDKGYDVDVLVDTGLAPSLDKIELVEGMMDFDLDIDGALHSVSVPAHSFPSPAPSTRVTLPLRNQHPSRRAIPSPPPSVCVAPTQRHHKPVAAHGNAARPAVPVTPGRQSPSCFNAILRSFCLCLWLSPFASLACVTD